MSTAMSISHHETAPRASRAGISTTARGGRKESRRSHSAPREAMVRCGGFFRGATVIAAACERSVARVHGHHRPCHASPNRTLAPICSTELP